MRIFVAHDNKTIKIGDDFYTTGAYSDEVFDRYINSEDDELVFFSRIIEIQALKEKKKYTKISKQNIKYFSIEKYSSLIDKELIKNLRNEIKCCDGVIVRLPSVLGLVSAYYARKYKLPLAVEVVGCAFDAYWNYSFIGKIIAPIFFIANQYAIKNSPYVIYVTERFLQKRYPTKGYSIGCSDVVLLEKNMADCLVEQKMKYLYEKLTRERKFTIGTIGAVDVKYKGQEYVIKAIKNLIDRGYDVTYQLIGGGNPSYLQKISEELEIKDRVYFLGTLPHEEIFKWLNNIDIYIQPSQVEGLPRSIIEAARENCFIMGSRVGGIPELINEEFTFPSKKYKDIAQRIESIDLEDLQKQRIQNNLLMEKFNKNVLKKKRDLFWDNYREYLMTEKKNPVIDEL